MKPRKDEWVRVRVTEEQKKLFEDAAAKTGLDLSSWFRMIAYQKAKELEKEHPS